MRTKEFRLVLTILLVLLGMQAKAEDKVLIQSATITAGEEFTLPIELVDELTYKACQMEIVLPEGITPVYAENEDEELALVIERGRMHSTHSLTDNYRAKEHILGLVCVSTSSKNFRSVEGPLFSVKLKADENLQAGSYDIKLTNIKFTSSDNVGYDFADATGTFTISGAVPPVVEKYTYQFVSDGVVLSSGELAAGDSLVAPVAPDKTGYIFIGWSPEFTGTMPAYNVVYKGVYEQKSYSQDKVLIQSATITAGEEFTLPIELVDELTYKAFQMEIVLPEGITPVYAENEDEEFELVIERGRMTSSHSITENFRAEEHTLGLVCVSTSGKNFRKVEGPLFSVKLKADKNLQAGSYDIKLTNIKFTSSDNVGYDFADATAIMTVSDAGRIEALQAQLADQIATANALLDSVKIYGEIRTQINDAIQQYMDAADINTLEKAVSLMQQLLDNANDYIQMYFQLSAALERLNGMLVDNGVRDPEILKNAQNYYNTIIAGFNAETLNYESALRAIELINSYISQLNKVALTINVEQAGTLANLISQQVDDYSGIVSLTVTGFLNSNDLSAIRILKDNLVTLNLEETNLTTIGYEALCSMVALKTIILPKNLNTIGEFAFNYCALENITFPASLRTISNYAFYYCFALKNVELPEGVTSLGYCSFGQCEQLKEVVLPSSITTVDRSFLYSNQITKITCKALVPPTANGRLMSYNENLCTLEVPILSVQSYQNATYWNYFNIVGGSYYGDNMVITSEITFNSNDSILQTLKPSINVTRVDNNWNSSYGALSVVGANTLSLTGYEMFFDAYMAQSEKYWGNYSRYSATLINQAPMRADNVAVKLRLNAYQWYFVCLPFDVKVSTIAPDRDTQFVIYKYDGKRRGDGDMANTWVKMTADSTLHAGTGYIWQTASAYVENMGEYYDITFSVKALNNSNKNNIFRNGDVQVKLSEYASELPHNRSWNLVGNPYPAYFNSRAMDINAPFTVWSVNNQNYEAFSPVDDHYVFAPGEAFFIQRPMDQATIPFLAAGRQNNAYQTDSVFFNNARQSVMPAKRSVFNLLLQLDNKTVDRTRVVINEEAILGYESDKDAAKFEAMSKVSQLYTLEGGQRYAINERPIDRGQMQLGAEFAMKATYTLVLETTVDEKVYLVDRLTGTEVLLNENGYTFDAEAGIANDRFMVRIATDETTGIKTIDSLNSEGTYYDLRGVRVEKPHKGLYINNGKKTVVK